ncbi:hypothetical protein [Thioalkalivibrio nitratireducens]|uniref:hypothetical protein n=1 Tax=Thioalkalivibrio nitratireducens TaxID=186931 RepID=UPI0009FB0829|nr:hypothetical protein [Thioalkalivibrio nitratireducens]
MAKNSYSRITDFGDGIVRPAMLETTSPLQRKGPQAAIRHPAPGFPQAPGGANAAWRMTLRSSVRVTRHATRVLSRQSRPTRNLCGSIPCFFSF